MREIKGTGEDQPTGSSDCGNDTPTTLQQPEHHHNTLIIITRKLCYHQDDHVMCPI